MTSAGGVSPEGVVRVNRFPQEDPSPAIPPAELTQTEIMLARV